MKGIVEMINEAAINEAASVDRKLSFDLQNDIYNVLADMGYEYDKKGKSFEENDVRKALDWVLEKFFEENDDND